MRAAIGLVLVRQKKLAEAEPFLTAGCREIADHCSQIPDYEYPYISDQFEILIGLYRDTKQTEKEKEWLAFKHETFDKLIRKNLTSGKLTANAITLVKPLIMEHIDSGRHDDAIALYQELDSKHAPTDQATSDTWFRTSGHVVNTYESRGERNHIKRWAELRVPTLKAKYEATRRENTKGRVALSAEHSLLFAYVHAGRNADAIKLAEEVIAHHKAAGWLTDPSSVGLYSGMVKAVVQVGRPDLGIDLSRAVLVELGKQPGVPVDLLALTHFALGFAQSAAGQYVDAETSLREAVRLQDKADSNHWKAAKFKLWLGLALLEQKKLSEGESNVLAAYTDVVDKLTAMPLWEKHLPLTTAERLVKLYERMDKPDEVKKWQAEKVKLVKPLQE